MVFWLDVTVLLKSLAVLPTSEMSVDEKLNALTRLSIIISLVLYVMLDSQQWLQFLLMAIGVIVVLFLINKVRTSREGFAITPTYSSDDFHQTTVAPLFAEEWQNPPPEYDLMTEVPETESFSAPLTPQSYPHGQYLTRTNLLPGDERAIHMGNGSLKTAREMAGSFWLRNDLAFREDMTRIYKKRLQRRFRHNCNDTFSPFHSY